MLVQSPGNDIRDKGEGYVDAILEAQGCSMGLPSTRRGEHLHLRPRIRLLLISSSDSDWRFRDFSFFRYDSVLFSATCSHGGAVLLQLSP